MAPATFDDASYDGGVHVVVVTGELDLTNVSELRRRAGSAFGDGEPRLVVDLAGVTHVDSSGLAELLELHQRARDLHGGLALVVTSQPIVRTLQIRGVDALFTVAPTRDEACAALTRA
jgi:anti-anti-sigma factor